MHKVKYEGVSKFSEMKIFQNEIYGETFIGIFIEVIHFVGGKKKPNKCVWTSFNQTSGNFLQRQSKQLFSPQLQPTAVTVSY